MFWALAMQPRKKYTQTIDKKLHVSMASMDLASSGNEPVRILVAHDNKQYLICTLKKDKLWQVPLDLNFKKDSPVSFICDGQGYIHLTGYMIPNKVDYSDTDFEKDKAKEKKDELVQMCMKRKAELQDHNCKRAKLTREESFDESSDDDDTDDSDSDKSTSSLEEDLDDKDMENGEKEESNDDEEEEQEHKQQKLATSQKHEGKKIENQQQKKNKHNKQNEINKEEIKQEQQSKKQNKKVEQQAQQTDNKKNTSNVNKVKKRTIEGGVQVEDTKIGNGLLAINGCLVTVYYVGRTKIGKEEQIIDEVIPGQSKGFKVRLGRGRSIKGFEMGVIGMKVGGKRRITIPPNMGYGAKGCPPQIPANSTLVYDIELAKVNY